jgi:hypothetical protein
VPAALAARLLARIPEARGLYYRLVLVVGPARSGKTEALAELAAAQGWPRVNVNLELAERLLDLTKKQRAVRIAGLLDEIVKVTPAEVVLLDNIEMLFAVELELDPLRLLQGLSRNRTIVAAWPGAFDGRALTYAEAAHREFKKYPTPQAVIVDAREPALADVAAPHEQTA